MIPHCLFDVSNTWMICHIVTRTDFSNVKIQICHNLTRRRDLTSQSERNAFNDRLRLSHSLKWCDIDNVLHRLEWSGSCKAPVAEVYVPRSTHFACRLSGVGEHWHQPRWADSRRSDKQVRGRSDSVLPGTGTPGQQCWNQHADVVLTLSLYSHAVFQYSRLSCPTVQPVRSAKGY